MTPAHTFRYAVSVPLSPGAAVELGPDDAHHLTRVVRRGPGDPVEVIDGDGRIWPGWIDEDGPVVTVRVGAAPRPAPPPAPVEVYVGLAEWGRIDLLIEKGTELGIGGLTLFTSDRSRRAEPDVFVRRRERMARLSEAAARQSGHGRRPQLRGLVPFSAVIDAIAATPAFLLDQAGEDSLGGALRRLAPPSAALVIGPDAGLSAAEIAAAVAAGAHRCALAAATLRAETAAIAACAISVDHYTAMPG